MLRLCIPVVLLATLSACGGVVDPSQNKNDPISGVIPKGSAYSQTYNVSKTGEYSVKIANMSPTISSNTYFLVAVYQGGCGGPLLGANQFSVVGATAVSGSIISGSYCVYVQDEGGFTVDETITGTFSHP